MYSTEILYRIFSKGMSVYGKDPSLYRKDKYGVLMYWHSYGKTTEMGWEVDHSKPISKGGTNHLNNLQPLNWKSNRAKGNSY